MVGMEYWCELPDATAISVADDLLFIAAPTDATVFIEEIEITQFDITTSDQARLQLFRTATDQAAVGVAITPDPVESGFAAFGGVCRDVRATADATITNSIFSIGQNLLNGWHIKGTYEEPILILSPTAGVASRAVIRLGTAPGAATEFVGRMKIRQIGG